MCISDVITIEKTGEFFRLIYDVKGRFTIHRITDDEAKVSWSCMENCETVINQNLFALSIIFKNSFFAFQYKLCKVKRVQTGPKGIPFLVTHDGRTVRYPDPVIKVNDTIQLDIATSKILDSIRFDSGKIQVDWDLKNNIRNRRYLI